MSTPVSYIAPIIRKDVTGDAYSSLGMLLLLSTNTQTHNRAYIVENAIIIESWTLAER